MKLHLGGHLAYYHPQKLSHLEVQVEGVEHLVDVLSRHQIPAAEVAIVMVNGKSAILEGLSISNQDQVELFPPLGGG